MESEGYNSKIESLRSGEYPEFPQLADVVYLDHAGSTLYSRSQLRAITDDLENTLLGNPHSGSSCSQETSQRIEQARAMILEHFNVKSDDYEVVFTSGATDGLHLVAESFAEGCSPGRFVYQMDSHTSVIGMRELMTVRGFHVQAAHFEEFSTVEKSTETEITADTECSISLTVFPAQCNFTGTKFNLELIDQCRKRQLKFQNNSLSDVEQWFVLLDAASLVATCPLNLALWSPDYVVLSFYKMFGYPTGLGALLVRRGAAEHLLRGRRYFGGGCVRAVLSDFAPRREQLHDVLEAGTLPFLQICSLPAGFKTLMRLGGGVSTIERHVFALAAYTRRELLSLRHLSTGVPLVDLYCPSECISVDHQGGVLAFNLRASDGSPIGYSVIESRAVAYHIALRTGCFCNVGACQRHLFISDVSLRTNLAAGHVCGDQIALVDGRHTGALRISFGYMSTRDDADKLIQMLQECFLSHPTAISVPIRGQTARLSGIFVYPVKSCAAMQVSEWPIGATGFLWDRSWLITNESGTVLTLKREPRLYTIRPVIDLTADTLTLHCSGHDSLVLPLVESDEQSAAARVCLSRVCGDRVQLSDCGSRATNWLGQVLNRPGCKLVRQCGPRGSESHLSLANECQFLMMQESSLRLLHKEIEQRKKCSNDKGVTLSLEELSGRFRGNLMVSDVDAALSEESWCGVQFTHNSQIITMRSEGVCNRCQMICVDEKTGETTREPMTSLSALKSGKLQFGIYLRLEEKPTEREEFWLRVGDGVKTF